MPAGWEAAMDAAGKDGTIKHVMSGINPQGCQVYSFKAPSSEDLDHDPTVARLRLGGAVRRRVVVAPTAHHVRVFQRFIAFAV